MKNFVQLFAFFLMINAYASIEHEPGRESYPTESEITRNRACFKELEVLGCGDPGDDARQFRTCMSEVYGSLSSDCKKLMDKLYKK